VEAPACGYFVDGPEPERGVPVHVREPGSFEAPVAIDPGGRYLALSSDDGISIWALAWGREVYMLRSSDPREWIWIEPGRLVHRDGEGQLIVIDINRGTWSEFESQALPTRAGVLPEGWTAEIYDESFRVTADGTQYDLNNGSTFNYACGRDRGYDEPVEDPRPLAVDRGGSRLLWTDRIFWMVCDLPLEYAGLWSERLLHLTDLGNGESIARWTVDLNVADAVFADQNCGTLVAGRDGWAAFLPMLPPWEGIRSRGLFATRIELLGGSIAGDLDLIVEEGEWPKYKSGHFVRWLSEDVRWGVGSLYESRLMIEHTWPKHESRHFVRWSSDGVTRSEHEIDNLRIEGDWSIKLVDGVAELRRRNDDTQHWLTYPSIGRDKHLRDGLAISPDGRLAAVSRALDIGTGIHLGEALMPGRVAIHDLANGLARWSIELDPHVTALALTNDELWIVVHETDHARLTIHDAHSGKQLRQWTTTTLPAAIVALAVHPESNAVYGLLPGQREIWRWSTHGQAQRQLGLASEPMPVSELGNCPCDPSGQWLRVSAHGEQLIVRGQHQYELLRVRDGASLLTAEQMFFAREVGHVLARDRARITASTGEATLWQLQMYHGGEWVWWDPSTLRGHSPGAKDMVSPKLELRAPIGARQ
jgi:hypothetical protein